MTKSAGTVPHRRYNLLTGEWVLVSPQRSSRPWLGRVDEPPSGTRPEYDPNCYLCPGNRRAGDHQNPDYSGIFVFDNDFPALLPQKTVSNSTTFTTMKSQNVSGTCRVICFSPRHDLTLAELPEEQILDVINVWAEQTAELGRTYRWVQVFENKGELMGCSNPHPHGQIWAGSALPNEPSKEHRRQRAYYREHGSALLLDYLKEELQAGERIVFENDHWVVLVPYWAIWPFETMVLPREPVRRLPELKPAQRHSLAGILKKLLPAYDRLFKVSFPYSGGWHGAPFGPGHYAGWQFHGHFYPPLLRSASIKKFMVGYELLAEAQRDLTPETAAEILRNI